MEEWERKEVVFLFFFLKKRKNIWIIYSNSTKIVLITSNRHFSYISIFMFSKPFEVKWFVVYEEASFINLHSSYSHREIIHIFQHKHGRASYYLGKKYINGKVSENDITNLMAQIILNFSFSLYPSFPMSLIYNP